MFSSAADSDDVERFPDEIIVLGNAVENIRSRALGDDWSNKEEEWLLSEWESLSRWHPESSGMTGQNLTQLRDLNNLEEMI